MSLVTRVVIAVGVILWLYCPRSQVCDEPSEDI